MQFEEAKQSGSATLGLRWQEAKLDVEKDDRGSEIVNHALAAALKEKQLFTAEELAKYGVCDEYYGRRIRVGGNRFFKPVASKKYKQYREVIDQLQRRDPDREQTTVE